MEKIESGKIKSGICELCGHPVHFSPGYDGPMIHSACKEKKDVKENRQLHLDHPFYKRVKKVVDQIEHEQIVKGSETYPEPFDPKSWTPKELLWHQMQELRDAQVYGVGLYELLEAQDAAYKNLLKDYEIEKQQSEFWRLRAVKLLDELDEAKGMNKQGETKGIFIDERV